MLRIVFHALILSLALAPTLLAQSQPAATGPMASRKKLIEFGWDEPDTAFLRKHIAEMEKTPFDGTVFHLDSDFLWTSWSPRKFTEQDLSGPIEDLKHTPLKTFTHNFLRFNVAPGDVDWFDDFSAILGNATLAAKIARDGRAAGILFDTEQYNAQLFNYAKQKHKDGKSFDDYAKQTRQRGRELMRAFQDGYPDLTVMLTFAYSLPYTAAGGDRARLAEVDYGLLVPLLDGMFDVAAGKAKIVDGFEMSYAYKGDAKFDRAAETMREKAVSLVADADKYRRHLSVGFGLWMDYDWRTKAWDEKDFSKNHFSPEQFEHSVRKALATADDYVWIYTETPRWWTPPDGKPAKLPQPYIDAVRRAKEGK